jgi:outer membrane receptor for ferrienterochelin and colicins
VDGDAWADVPGYRRFTLRPRVFWNGTSNQSLFATVGVVDEDREGGTLPGRALADGTTFREALHTRRVDGGAVTQFALEDGRQFSSRWSVVRNEQDRTFGPQRTEDTQTTAFGEMTLGGNGRGHTWVLGLAFNYDQLRAAEAPGVGYSYAVPAAFMQDEFSPTESVALTASARLDAHSDYGTFFSPRISALFRLSAEWQLRASFGTGFAPPTPFTDEIEATGLSVLDPLRGLRAERAVSSSLDARWKADSWEINGSLFNSQIRDPLDVRAAAVPGRLELVNDDGPRRASGAELRVSYVNGALHVLANSTFLDVTESSPAGGRRTAELIPRYTAELAVLLEDEERGRVGLEIASTGRQTLADDPYRTSGDAYVELNALAEVKFGETSVFLNAINLTDERQTHFDPLLRPAPGPGGQRITEVWAPLAGRTFNLGVRLEL